MLAKNFLKRYNHFPFNYLSNLIHLKPQNSFLAICIAASLHAPLVLAEANQAVPNANASEVKPVNGIGDIYSDIDLKVTLATKANEKPCAGDTCLANQLFDARVKALGERLTQSAYVVYPDLKKKVPKFEFSVADKKNIGSASNASGKVVLFRGFQHLDLGEEAMAFLVAREMGHVIADHHKSNAKTKLFFTVLTGVLFPAVSILSASSAAAQATTATTLLTSAASTATSFVGSEVALSRIKPTQLTEADNVSLALLEHDGLSKLEVAQALEFIVENENSSGWEKDLNQSIHYVRKLAGEPLETDLAYDAELELLPEEYIADGAMATPDIAEQNQAENLENINEKPQIQLAQNPKNDTQIKLVASELTEQAPVKTKPLPIQNEAIKPPEAKLVQAPKIILITNETLAESRKTIVAPTKPNNLVASKKLNIVEKSSKPSKFSNKTAHVTTVKAQANTRKMAKVKNETLKTNKNALAKQTKPATKLISVKNKTVINDSKKLTIKD